MTEHLPECPNHFIGLPADYMERDVYMRRCMCEKLRACEERIKTHEGCADAERIEGYVDGYGAALAAALHALYLMENMGGYPEFDFDHIRDDFRDVIDALKEGS